MIPWIHDDVSKNSGPCRKAKSMMEPLRLHQNSRALPEVLARRLVASLLPLCLTACTSLGEKFAPENAINVRNGMTREQVIAIMGSPPSEVEGHDRGYLLWLHSTATPASYGVETQKVMFTLDETGRVYGISKGGLNPDSPRSADHTE